MTLLNLNKPTVWRWAKPRAELILRRINPDIAPIRPQHPDEFIVTSDPYRIARANLAQWWASAPLRLMPGTPLYTPASVIALTMRAQNRCLIEQRAQTREELRQSGLFSCDLIALSKMLPHCSLLHSHNLPCDIMVVTERLDRESVPPCHDPNDDWRHDGMQVQIIVKNPQRVMSLLHTYLSHADIPVSVPTRGYGGLYATICGPNTLTDRDGREYQYDGRYYRNEHGGYSAQQIVGAIADKLRASAFQKN